LGSDQADVVIVGNGVAGFNCARRLARQGVRPVLVGPGLPYDRPPLTKAALAAGVATPFADAEKLAESGIVHIDGRARDVDPGSLRVTVEDGGEARELEASAVVLAVGLSYLPPPVPGLESAYVNATPAGMAALSAHLAGTPKHVLIVGAGLIGVESAATLATGGHRVTLVDLEERPLPRIHEPVPQIAAAIVEELGVTFLGGVRIASADLSGVETETHGRLEADVVVAATGGRPAPVPWLPDKAFPIEVEGSMGVPGHPGLFAIGDCAAPLHPRYGRLRFPHWDAAVGTAERAAEAITGTPGEYERLPYWWTDIGSRRLAEVGLADLAVEWNDEDGLQVGRDDEGRPVAVLVAEDPRRLREARELLVEVA
jgi:NADPH-dependent 2,4-dienoyl-CoA reductase/sulfur reductase-like enzyme